MPNDQFKAVPAPDFPGITTWLNTEPLTPKDLKGKVTVVHFWTNGCINCVHNYPQYRDWQEKYAKEKSFLMLGVHTPEFDAEKDTDRIKTRMADNKLTFAVAVDNDQKTWQAWGNHNWPCVYVVDKKGMVRYRWAGELQENGTKAATKVIDDLLAEKP